MYIAHGCAELQFLYVSCYPSMSEVILNILSSLNHIQELRVDYHKFAGRSFSSIPVLCQNSVLSIVLGCIMVV
jgi:hypothetical protein